MLYMRPKRLTDANHDTMLDLGCDCGVCFLNTQEPPIVKNVVDPKHYLRLRFWFVGRVYKMRRKFDNCGVEYRDPIDLMDCPSNMEIVFSWFQIVTNNK